MPYHSYMLSKPLTTNSAWVRFLLGVGVLGLGCDGWCTAFGLLLLKDHFKFKIILADGALVPVTLLDVPLEVVFAGKHLLQWGNFMSFPFS